PVSTERCTACPLTRANPSIWNTKPKSRRLAMNARRTSGRMRASPGPTIKVVYGYMGEGYGVVGDLEREAIRLMARFEGIVLDPVYAGRAFGALVDLIRKGVFKRHETVLFWHTGGSPALFAYANELL